MKHAVLKPSSVVLRQYDGTILPTSRELKVTVTHGNQQVAGRFVVVENADRQLPLLGRDWLYNLRLDWPKLLSSKSKADPRVHTLHTAEWISRSDKRRSRTAEGPQGGGEAKRGSITAVLQEQTSAICTS